jgi:hypothetical protein
MHVIHFCFYFLNLTSDLFFRVIIFTNKNEFTIFQKQKKLAQISNSNNKRLDYPHLINFSYS